MRARLLGRTLFTPEQQLKREANVRTAAAEAMQGRGPVRPLNPSWDRAFLTLLGQREWSRIDAFTPASVDAVAGAGGNEVLCWTAAAAAMSSAAGAYEVVQQDCLPIDGWIAGMAHLAARA